MSESRMDRTIPFWLVLLTISILINYIDRGNLAVAAPLLKDELHLTNTQVGVLITAFFWTYTAVLAVSGWIVDRLNVNWVLAAGFALWSLATAATGLVHGFGLLLAFRMLLGLGESVAFPSYSKMIALNVPQQHRGIANAMIISGMSLGPAVGTYGCGISMAHYGWRPVFIVIGLASLIWLLPWMSFMPDTVLTRSGSSSSVSTMRVLRERNFWATAVGQFCCNYPFYFLIVWLPLYLVRERHFTMQQMAKEAALYYILYAVVSPIVGWTADHFVRRGAEITVVRKAAMGTGHALVAAGVLACGAADSRISFAGLAVMGIGSGFVGPNIYVFAQTLAGPSMAGKWTGLQTCVANLAGVVVGPLTGWIVDRTGRFGAAFSVCAAIEVFGGICWVLLVGRLQQTAWPSEPELSAVGVATEAT
ncbi:MAG: MFS transporter [Acidobacteriaceae bacterium]|nr:MFS transporter [Acidobacteriaceae bacterium]